MRKQQLWTGIGAFIGILVLILDGRTALNSAQQGLELCLRTVIPSLFPFFLLSILLTNAFLGTNIPLLHPLAKLFHIPKGAESILICAFLGGYPVGAQSISEAYRAGQLSQKEAERLLSYCNNAGPAFLFGIIGTMFPSRWMVWALWGIHILSALLVSIFFVDCTESVQLSAKMDISITSAMSSAIRIMASVCGWVVLFRVLIGFLNSWILWLFPEVLQVVLTGILELSNGCCNLTAISDVALRFLICSIILAFGGLCVTMQTISVTGGLSLRQYFLGKLMQVVFSAFLSFGILYHCWLAILCPILYWLIFHQKMRKKSRNPYPVGV